MASVERIGALDVARDWEELVWEVRD